MAAMDQKLSLKLAQRLIMTPSLQQAIRLLQLSKLELQEEISQELVENPVLEERDGEEGEASQTEEKAEFEADGEEAKERLDEAEMEEYFREWEQSQAYTRSSMSGMRETFELPALENTPASPPDLSDHLLWQLGDASHSERETAIGEAIIGNIDEHGYLQATLDEIRAMGGWDLEEVEQALAMVQRFDPIGVGARDLTECLLLQLRHMDLLGTPAEGIVREQLDLLKNRRYDEIAKRLGIRREEAEQYSEVVKHLDPKPGLSYSAERPAYVTPDVFVVKVGDEYRVVLNDDGLPRLRISPVYRRMLDKGADTSKEARSYVRDKFRSALWFLKSLEERQRTIYKVASSIVKHQRGFFDQGIEQLRPLILRNVAEDVEMHESTVSRVVNNKYMHTPRGLFEMRFFFHSGIGKDGAADVSSLAVKQRIREIIEGEDARRPHSDSRIAKILHEEGLQIARRTVAKYREELAIPPSTARKRR